MQQPQSAVVGSEEGPVRQHLHNQLLLQRISGSEIRQAANADVLQHRAQTHAGVIGGISTAHTHRHRLAAFLEFPARIARGFAQINAAVIEQIVRVRRRAVFGQVLRRGAQQMVNGQQLPPDQSGRWPIRDTNRQIDMVVDQIDLSVFEQQFDIDLGVTPQKLGHVRMNHETPHRFRYADPHQAFRFMGELAADFHHRSGSADHLLTTLEDLFAAVTQTQFARGALQQSRGQGLFQARNAATHR